MAPGSVEWGVVLHLEPGREADDAERGAADSQRPLRHRRRHLACWIIRSRQRKGWRSLLLLEVRFANWCLGQMRLSVVRCLVT